MELVRYDAACRAVAECKTVDEARDIRDKAVAMAAYARQAKNKDLEADALEIRMRATRRIHELVEAQRETVGLAKGGQPYQSTGATNAPVENRRPTLAQAGIDKHLAKDVRALGRLAPEAFEKAVGEARVAVTQTVRTALRAGDKAEHRAERERSLGDAQRALPGAKFGVIYADPPWRFEPYSRDTGMDRAPENHYATMDLAEIKAIAVPAADDAALFLWATAPMLPQALEVMAAWGFSYRTNFVWAKDKIGTGYWTRSRHELLLLGIRGGVPAPAPGQQFDSVVYASRGRHSAKPPVFREMIERMFPTLPRIELFARDRSAGWDAWGVEVDAAEQTTILAARTGRQ